MIRTNIAETVGSRSVTERLGRFSVIEYEKDLSVTPHSAQTAWFASSMNVRKRQVLADLDDDHGVIIQAGAMQMMLGQVDMVTGVKGVGDLMKKAVGSAVTGETVLKPHYIGNGSVVLEPTFQYILLEDMTAWPDGLVIQDGMFLGCDDSIEMKVCARKNVSSALFGKEGLFNTVLFGEGTVVLESSVPRDELFVMDLENDELKIDGNQAVCWSGSLSFTVERTAPTLIGSAASKEGLVNVYRGTGRVLVAPVAANRGISVPKEEK